MNETRFAIRTVRNGRVLIHGNHYQPESQFKEYDGRLEGMRFAFGRYPGHQNPGAYQPYVCLWSLAKNFYAPEEDWLPNPAEVDGKLPWVWWNAVILERRTVCLTARNIRTVT